MDDCLFLSYRDLKALLTHHNVPGRSRFTTKQDMCEELVRLGLPLSTSLPPPPNRRAPRASTPRASTPRPPSPDSPSYNIDDCLSFSYHDLKSILSHYNVPYRSKLTTKDTMCQELLKRNLPLSSSSSPAQTRAPQTRTQQTRTQQTRSPQTRSPQTRAPRASQSRQESPVVPDMSRLDLLPRELQLEILKKLDSETLLEVCRVNKAFANLCRDEQLWSRFAQEDFGTSTKLVESESWYSNYRIFRARKRQFFNLFSPTNLDRFLRIYTVPVTITDDAVDYLLELFKPMINELITMPNTPNKLREFVDTYFPESLRNEILRHYQQSQHETSIVSYILAYTFDILGLHFGYKDYDEDDYEEDFEINITADDIRELLDNDDYELKSIFKL